jgi:predicted lipid-binding transport protein (Tim44 family)
MKCPRCEAEVEGRFCGFCGGALEARQCPACSSPVPPAFRFCGECGAEQGGGAGGSPRREEDTVAVAVNRSASDRKRWWIAGAAVAGAVLFLTLPYVWSGWADTGNAPRMPVSPAAASPGSAAAVDLSTMTPREAADRLFNRVMTAQGAGDDAELEAFLPMAIDAYRRVSNLDADGHFHLALLQQAAGDHAAALATAERVLASAPDHLLALYAAGEAARGLGDIEQARGHFRQLLDVYEAESVRNLTEYREHETFLLTIRETADRYLAGGA